MKLLKIYFVFLFTLLFVNILIVSCIVNKDPLSVIDNEENYEKIWEMPEGYNEELRDKILFTTTRRIIPESSLNIFMINSNGNGIQPLINHGITSIATWSPQKWKILYTSHDSLDHNRILYIVDPDGNNRIRITDEEEDVIYARMSPDGKKIAYIVVGENGRYKIKSISSDNPVAVEITDWFVGLYRFCWTIDSEQILFSAAEGTFRISSIDITNNELSIFLDFQGGAYNPDISPDGKMVLFTSPSHIFVYDIENKTINQLTNGSNLNFSPSWSSNGEYIVYESRVPGPYSPGNIYRMDYDGSNQIQLTDNIGKDYNPCWQ